MKKNNKTAQETKIVSLRLCLHILKRNGSLRLLNIIISSNKFIIYNVFELRNKPKESISKHAFNLNIYISAFESGVLRVRVIKACFSTMCDFSILAPPFRHFWLLLRPLTPNLTFRKFLLRLRNSACKLADMYYLSSVSKCRLDPGTNCARDPSIQHSWSVLLNFSDQMGN